MKILTALNLCYKSFVVGDSAAAFTLLRRIGKVVYPSYRFIAADLDVMHNEGFNRFLERFGDSQWDRRWTVSQLVRLTLDVSGDTVECGAFRGVMSWVICASNETNGKTHHIFDSFEGLSEPDAADGAYWTKGDFATSEQTVAQNLAEFERVRLYKGWIPARFDEVAHKRFSFVHIDVDLHQPTADSIEFFYPRLSDGGILVCDDYGHTTCPGATKAIDGYLEEKAEKMLSLPTGGGFFIKGRKTDEVTRWERSNTFSEHRKNDDVAVSNNGNVEGRNTYLRDGRGVESRIEPMV